MKFALREVRRAKVRFAMLVASVALLVFLILFQQALQDGLITSFVGAIRNQSAPVLVYSVDGRRNLQGSVLTPAISEAVLAVDGVGESGRLGQGTFTVRRDGDGTSSVTVIGYDLDAPGAPTTLRDGRMPRGEGEVVALASSEEAFRLGDTVSVMPGELELTVVGRADEIGLQASTTFFTDFATYERGVLAANPDARGAPTAALALDPAEGVTPEELVERINDAVPDAEALTRQQAADESPGVAQVRQSFQVIFGLFGLVVPLVTGLFFLIVTLQKAGSLTLLRAVGIPGSALVRSLLFQVALVLAVGIALGVALYAPLSAQRVGSIPLSFSTGTVLGWAAVLLLLGVGSALFAARRVLAIDPVEAASGAGVGGR